MRARELRQSSPDAERALWQRLRDRQLGGYKFRRQRPIVGYFADFMCLDAKLIVELDGGQHFEPEGVAKDAKRTQVLNALGFHVMRFTDREALMEPEAVLSQVLDWLQAHHPHPHPLPQAGEGATHPAPAAAGGESTY